MLIEGGRDDGDVIQVAKSLRLQIRGNDAVDKALKGDPYRVQPEWYDSKNCIRPRLGTMKTVSGLLYSVSGIYQYLVFRSMVDRYVAPLKLSSIVLTWGSG